MFKLTGFAWYYLAWLIAFLVPEIYFAITNNANTLSHEVWSIEGLSTRMPYDFGMWSDMHWAIALGVWLLFLWLSLHIPFGLLR